MYRFGVSILEDPPTLNANRFRHAGFTLEVINSMGGIGGGT